MHVRLTQGKPPVLAPTLPEDCEGHVGASLPAAEACLSLGPPLVPWRDGAAAVTQPSLSFWEVAHAGEGHRPGFWGQTSARTHWMLLTLHKGKARRRGSLLGVVWGRVSGPDRRDATVASFPLVPSRGGCCPERGGREASRIPICKGG